MKLSTAKKIVKFQVLTEDEIYDIMEEMCVNVVTCLDCPLWEANANNTICPVSERGDLITFYLRHGYFKGEQGG